MGEPHAAQNSAELAESTPQRGHFMELDGSVQTTADEERTQTSDALAGRRGTGRAREAMKIGRRSAQLCDE
jgi:hypothetical protein